VIELYASCGYCTWGPQVWSEDEKERKEQAHRDRWHADVAPDTDEMCARMIDEHADARTLVVKAIEAVALLNGGQVDPNAVRDTLPRDLKPPQIIGAVYRMMRAPGGLDGRQLVEDGDVVSTDSHGRNTGKRVPRYRLVNAARRTA